MLKASTLVTIVMVCCMNFAHAQTKALEDYLQKGLANSPLLKDYIYQRAANTLDSMKVLATLKPQVGATGQVMVAPTIGKFGYDGSATNGGAYSGLVGVTQPLFTAKLKRGEFQRLALQNQTLLNSTNLTAWELKKSITTQYITTYLDAQQIGFLREVRHVLEAEEKIVKQLVEKGVYLQTDFYTLRVSIRAQTLSVEQARVLYRHDLALLHWICGEVDTNMVELQKPSTILTTLPVLSETPAMKQFGIDSLTNWNAKALVDLNYIPKVNAFADAGFNAIAPQNIWMNFGVSAGLNVSVPIYDGKQRRLEYGKINLKEKARTQYRDFYIAQYQQRFLQLQQELSGIENLLTDIKAQIKEQEQLITLYQLEMEKGLVRFSDFILTINNYINTKNTLIQAEGNRLFIITELNYLK